MSLISDTWLPCCRRVVNFFPKRLRPCSAFFVRLNKHFIWTPRQIFMKFGVEDFYTEKLSSKREFPENPLTGNPTLLKGVK